MVKKEETEKKETENDSSDSANKKILKNYDTIIELSKVNVKDMIRLLVDKKYDNNYKVNLELFNENPKDYIEEKIDEINTILDKIIEDRETQKATNKEEKNLAEKLKDRAGIKGEIKTLKDRFNQYVEFKNDIVFSNLSDACNSYLKDDTINNKFLDVICNKIVEINTPIVEINTPRNETKTTQNDNNYGNEENFSDDEDEEEDEEDYDEDYDEDNDEYYDEGNEYYGFGGGTKNINPTIIETNYFCQKNAMDLNLEYDNKDNQLSKHNIFKNVKSKSKFKFFHTFEFHNKKDADDFKKTIINSDDFLDGNKKFYVKYHNLSDIWLPTIKYLLKNIFYGYTGNNLQEMNVLVESFSNYLSLDGKFKKEMMTNYDKIIESNHNGIDYDLEKEVINTISLLFSKMATNDSNPKLRFILNDYHRGWSFYPLDENKIDANNKIIEEEVEIRKEHEKKISELKSEDPCRNLKEKYYNMKISLIDNFKLKKNNNKENTLNILQNFFRLNQKLSFELDKIYNFYDDLILNKFNDCADSLVFQNNQSNDLDNMIIQTKNFREKYLSLGKSKDDKKFVDLHNNVRTYFNDSKIDDNFFNDVSAQLYGNTEAINSIFGTDYFGKDFFKNYYFKKKLGKNLEMFKSRILSDLSNDINKNIEDYQNCFLKKIKIKYGESSKTMDGDLTSDHIIQISNQLKKTSNNFSLDNPIYGTNLDGKRGILQGASQSLQFWFKEKGSYVNERGVKFKRRGPYYYYAFENMRSGDKKWRIDDSYKLNVNEFRDVFDEKIVSDKIINNFKNIAKEKGYFYDKFKKYVIDDHIFGQFNKDSPVYYDNSFIKTLFNIIFPNYESEKIMFNRINNSKSNIDDKIEKFIDSIFFKKQNQEESEEKANNPDDEEFFNYPKIVPPNPDSWDPFNNWGGGPIETVNEYNDNTVFSVEAEEKANDPKDEVRFYYQFAKFVPCLAKFEGEDKIIKCFKYYKNRLPIKDSEELLFFPTNENFEVYKSTGSIKPKKIFIKYEYRSKKLNVINPFNVNEKELDDIFLINDENKSYEKTIGNGVLKNLDFEYYDINRNLEILNKLCGNDELKDTFEEIYNYSSENNYEIDSRPDPTSYAEALQVKIEESKNQKKAEEIFAEKFNDIVNKIKEIFNRYKITLNRDVKTISLKNDDKKKLILGVGTKNIYPRYNKILKAFISDRKLMDLDSSINKDFICEWKEISNIEMSDKDKKSKEIKFINENYSELLMIKEEILRRIDNINKLNDAIKIMKEDIKKVLDESGELSETLENIKEKINNYLLCNLLNENKFGEAISGKVIPVEIVCDNNDQSKGPKSPSKGGNRFIIDDPLDSDFYE